MLFRCNEGRHGLIKVIAGLLAAFLMAGCASQTAELEPEYYAVEGVKGTVLYVDDRLDLTLARQVYTKLLREEVIVNVERGEDSFLERTMIKHGYSEQQLRRVDFNSFVDGGGGLRNDLTISPPDQCTEPTTHEFSLNDPAFPAVEFYFCAYYLGEGDVQINEYVRLYKFSIDDILAQ